MKRLLCCWAAGVVLLALAGCANTSGIGDAIMNRADFRALDAEEVNERAKTVKVKIPTTIVTYKGLNVHNDKKEVEVKAGTVVRVLAQVDDEGKPGHKGMRSDFLIELPDGTRGIGPLPEAYIGERGLEYKGTSDPHAAPDTVVLTDIVKEKSSNPYSAPVYQYVVKTLRGDGKTKTLSAAPIWERDVVLPLVSVQWALYCRDARRIKAQLEGCTLQEADSVLLPAQYVCKEEGKTWAVYSHIAPAHTEHGTEGGLVLIFENGRLAGVDGMRAVDRPWSQSLPGMEWWGSHAGATPDGWKVYADFPKCSGFSFWWFGRFFRPFIGFLLVLLCFAAAFALPWLLAFFVWGRIRLLANWLILLVTYLSQAAALWFALCFTMWGCAIFWVVCATVLAVGLFTAPTYMATLAFRGERCPYCHRMKNISYIGTEDRGSFTARSGVKQRDDYSHTEVAYEDNKKIVTRYYERKNYRTVTEVESGDELYHCNNCGKDFKVSFTFRNSYDVKA